MSDPKPHDEPASIPYATPAPRRRPAVPFVAVFVVLALVAGLALWVLARRVTVTVNVAPAAAAPATPAAPLTAATAPAPWLAPPPPPPPPPPPVLALPAVPPRLTIAQRRSQPIPGSANTVFVRLDDISVGRVRVDVHTADFRNLAGKVLRPGDVVEFTLDGKRYVVVAAEFHPRLTGTDYAEFVIRRAEDPPTGEERIGRLLDAAGKSGAVVVTPADAESKPLDAYLRDVWTFRKPRSTTPEALAAQAVRPAGPAAAPPRVRLRDGREMPLDEWLKAEVPKLK